MKCLPAFLDNCFCCVYSQVVFITVVLVCFKLDFLIVAPSGIILAVASTENISAVKSEK